jgi:hypothetical protein
VACRCHLAWWSRSLYAFYFEVSNKTTIFTGTALLACHRVPCLRSAVRGASTGVHRPARLLRDPAPCMSAARLSVDSKKPIEPSPRVLLLMCCDPILMQRCCPPIRTAVGRSGGQMTNCRPKMLREEDMLFCATWVLNIDHTRFSHVIGFGDESALFNYLDHVWIFSMWQFMSMIDKFFSRPLSIPCVSYWHCTGKAFSFFTWWMACRAVGLCLATTTNCVLWTSAPVLLCWADEQIGEARSRTRDSSTSAHVHLHPARSIYRTGIYASKIPKHKPADLKQQDPNIIG